MNKADTTKGKCNQFIRKSLPAIREVAANIKKIPGFYAKPDEIKTGRYKFVEIEQQNWWQLPKGLKESRGEFKGL